MHEAQVHESKCPCGCQLLGGVPRNSFVTLTYGPEHLPVDLGLDVSHFQKFVKRLRKKTWFRYFHCGEYGDKNLRPHYHALLFGEDFAADRYVVRRSNGYVYWSSPTLEKAWGMGHVLIGNVSFQSAAYCARYSLKKVGGAAADEHYRRGDVIVPREYTTMSRRPGIGAAWLAKYGSDVYPSDEVRMNGKKFPVPKFYDRQVEKVDPAFMEGVRKARVRRAIAMADQVTPERLEARGAIMESRQAELTREL